MKIIGIDPGFKGAIAFVEDGDLVEVEDMPIVPISYKGKSRNEIDAAQLVWIFERMHTVMEAERIVFERVGPMPQQGITGAFRFGEGYGMLRAAAATTCLPTDFVTPAVWKRYHNLSRDKGVSRGLAKQLWPRQSAKFNLARDDGRAEAALIALWREKQ